MPINAHKVFQWIAKLSAQAHWTDEELQDALREAGIDPVEFADSIVNRLHKLGCDEYHAHHAPQCCRTDCWCLQPTQTKDQEAQCPK